MQQLGIRAAPALTIGFRVAYGLEQDARIGARTMPHTLDPAGHFTFSERDEGGDGGKNLPDGSLLVHRKTLIQFKIEFQEVHARFAEKSELPARRMLRYQHANLFHAGTALLRNSRDLEIGCRGRDVGIEAGG